MPHHFVVLIKNHLIIIKLCFISMIDQWWNITKLLTWLIKFRICIFQSMASSMRLLFIDINSLFSYLLISFFGQDRLSFWVVFSILLFDQCTPKASSSTRFYVYFFNSFFEIVHIETLENLMISTNAKFWVRWHFFTVWYWWICELFLFVAIIKFRWEMFRLRVWAFNLDWRQLFDTKFAHDLNCIPTFLKWLHLK